jgi:hypothetical protein
MVRSGLRDRHIYARPRNVAAPRHRNPCHRQRRKIVIADSRPVSRRNHPPGVVNLRKSDLSLPALDGVLMANFLHFINHQGAFIATLRPLSERVLVVEYEWQAAKSMGNHHRPHSALADRTPAEFAARCSGGIDIGMRSLAFPVTPPCVRVRTRRFVRIKRRKCNAT